MPERFSINCPDGIKSSCNRLFYLIKYEKLREDERVSEIRIETINSKSGKKRFIKFPWKIYKGDQNWVPPLISDMEEKLDLDKNVFFEHAEMELFMAYRGDEPVGRIAAILDEAHIRFNNEKAAFFGLFESINNGEVASALLNRAAQWGRDKKMSILRGPMNLSMNDECAFLLEGFDSPPVIMMPYNPPYYIELMQKCGMKKAKDLYAYLMTRDRETKKRIDAVVEKVKKKLPVTLRSANLKDIDNEAMRIKSIYNQGWVDNWGFVPWTDKEMEHMAKKLKVLADPDLIIFAESKGQPVGFAFGLPNLNEVLQKLNGRLFPFGFLKFIIYKNKIKGFRAVVFGLVKEFHNTGLSYYLYSQLEKNALEKGYQWAETSWQLEDNDAVNRFAESVGGKLYKKYRLFEKELDS
jgi:GNAT superfamily N-acetyltransferase